MQGDDESQRPAFVPLRVPGEWTSVTHRLRHVAAALPEALALTGPDGRLTYGRLLARVDGWGAAIARQERHRAHEGAPIAVVMDGTVAAVCAFLAVLAAGRMAMPIDPTFPDERVHALLDRAGARLLDVSALPADAASVPEQAGSGVPVPGEPLPETPVPGASATSPADGGVNEDTPAAVIFTSGSTGAPKGCVHDHGAWLHQAYIGRMTHDQAPGVRNAMVLPLSFGGGLDIVFCALLNGASLHVRDVRLTGLAGMPQWLADEGVTHLHATPSLLTAIIDDAPPPALPAPVRLTTAGGEPVPWSLVRRVRDAAEGPVSFCVLSGASEIGSLAFLRVEPDEDADREGFLPVGGIVPNKSVEIVDDEGRPVPDGESGRLRVTARYLSSGYFDDPARTDEAFEVSPDGVWTYHAADLARWEAPGVLRLMGRADQAMKVGGYLVAPLEVEAAILAAAPVVEAVVTTVDAGGRQRLVAHVVPAQTDRPLIEAALRRRLRELLPAWMVPSRIVMMPALPRNERGKVSRGDLPTPPALPVLEPRTPAERLLATIWQSVLGLDAVSVDADFWALGADSLAVAEMLAQVETATGRSLDSAALVAAPTIAELAQVIDAGRGGSRATGRGSRVAGRGPRAKGEGSRAGGERDLPGSAARLPGTAVRLRRGDHPARLHVFAGGGAPALALLPLVTALRADVETIGYQAAGYERRGPVDRTLNAVLRRHLGVITRTGPETPLVLAGHSYGGILALECAAILRERGYDVRLVAVLDSIVSDRFLDRAVGPGHRPADLPGSPRGIAPPWGERMRTHARQVTAGWTRHPQRLQNAVFWEQSLRLFNRHRPHRWEAPTVVFTAPDNPNDLTWWGELLAGPHEVVPVAGGHTSILRPPFDRPVVDRLDAELARIAQGSAPRG
ncbi:hypothetical protein AOA12_03115 [Microbacterium sp. No. 7]|nr:hypothetical protein AOA12_03115 [Microbacterium sp. No. 7]